MADELLVALHDGLARVGSGAKEMGEQLTALYALKEVLHYLEARGIPAAHRRPLQDLLAAVLARSEGAVEHPILAAPEERKAARPPLPFDILNRRGAAAAAMEIVKRDGQSREQAARWVADRISWKMPDATWRAVAGWRDDASRGNHTLVDTETFDRARAALRHSPTPNGQAERRAAAVLAAAGLIRGFEQRAD